MLTIKDKLFALKNNYKRNIKHKENVLLLFQTTSSSTSILASFRVYNEGGGGRMLVGIAFEDFRDSSFISLTFSIKISPRSLRV